MRRLKFATYQIGRFTFAARTLHFHSVEIGATIRVTVGDGVFSRRGNFTRNNTKI